MKRRVVTMVTVLFLVSGAAAETAGLISVESARPSLRDVAGRGDFAFFSRSPSPLNSRRVGMHFGLLGG